MIDLTPPKQDVDASAPESGERIDDNEVIDIRGRPLEMTEVERNQVYCSSYHKFVLVDDDERIIACRECGKVLDPFDYILSWAKEGTRRMERLKALDNEIRLKHNEIEAMKQVLAREKSKIRAVNPDAPEVLTWKRQLAKRRDQA